MHIDAGTANDMRDFKLWIQEEHKYVDMYPVFYRNEVRRNVEQTRTEKSKSVPRPRITTANKSSPTRRASSDQPSDQ